MSFATLLDNTARQFPDKIALVEDDLRWNYRVLAAKSCCVARNLAAAGVQPGDRIALHMTNRRELAVIYFACARVGAIAVPINTRMRPAEIEFVLSHSGASVYIGSSELAPLALARSGRPHGLKRVFVLDPANILTQGSPYEELLAEPRSTSLPSIDADQAAVILYTSGSTARPKGAIHSHRAIIAAASLGQPGILTDSVVAQATSMMHAGGFSNLIASIKTAATFVLLPVFDADRVLDAIERHRCTYFSGLPFMFHALLERQLAKHRHVASATTFHAGGDTVPAALQTRFAAAFGHPLREGYGSTEAGRITHQPMDCRVRVGSIGMPVAGIEVKVVDSEGQPARVGEAGELMIRTPGMMSGYWQDPAATAEVLQDGWLRSGDTVRRDGDGYLWFLGRKREMIVRGGANVAPPEIESVLLEHPAVAESAVVGLPDAVMGERIAAVIRTRSKGLATEAELIDFARARLADYKVPERIWFRAALPKNAGGKIQRGLLREQLLYEGNRDKDDCPAPSPT